MKLNTRRADIGETTTEAREIVRTWADGFGIWHAVVPAGADAPRQARAAIREELRARGELGTGYRVRVTREAPTLAQARDGRAHYREVCRDA